MRIIYVKNFRRGLATNSSSTHSLIYRNDGELFKDLNIFECNYYDRCTNTIAATREAKIKYVLADIMYNDALVEIMSAFYPEMKEYYPLVKKHFDNKGDYEKYDEGLGMYCRGNLNFSDNIQASVDYLRHVIDNPEIIIVGGSDEQEFVYDTTEGHDECADPDGIVMFGKYKDIGVTKNGNYWVGYGDTNDRIVVRNENERKDSDYYTPVRHCSGGRMRYMTEQGEPTPEFPELIDIKVTNKCNRGCKFCFMDSNMEGKHADIKFLRGVIRDCGNANETKKHRVEFSIGGGNVLLYPDLEEFLKFLKEYGHIANVTVNIKDCEDIIKSRKLKQIFKQYVDGIGVSITSVDDIPTLQKFYNMFGEDGGLNRKYIVAHLIPEYLGVEKTVAIRKAIYDTDKMYVPILMLGYKTNGRGENCEWTHFTSDELAEIFKDSWSVSIDTTFGNRYFDWIKDNFSYKHTITLNEGEFSMYIDAVEQKAYKSSYQVNKPHEIEPGSWTGNGVKEVFGDIRKEGGFEVYDAEKHKYYNR